MLTDALKHTRRRCHADIISQAARRLDFILIWVQVFYVMRLMFYMRIDAYRIDYTRKENLESVSKRSHVDNNY